MITNEAYLHKIIPSLDLQTPLNLICSKISSDKRSTLVSLLEKTKWILPQTPGCEAVKKEVLTRFRTLLSHNTYPNARAAVVVS